MAQALGHKFGQSIGNFLEKYILMKVLDEIVKNDDFFVDKNQKRRARGNKKNVIWEDAQGNKHKLDYVIERNGTEDKFGDPIAFIEVAWRRYTKHSKNKAQEIQGAILPIVEKHKALNPFIGVLLAGEFTKPSLEQLESIGFKLIYFKYQDLVNVFLTENVDISTSEDTLEEDIEKK